MFYGSLVALVTPLLPNDQLDEKSLRNLVRAHVKANTRGIVCFGICEESLTLSDQKKIRILEICIEEGEGKIQIIAGIGDNDREKALFVAKKAKELKADGILLGFPYKNHDNFWDRITSHYQKLAEVGVPIIAQDCREKKSQNSMLKPADWQKIAKINGVVAINESSGNLKWIEELSLRINTPILTGVDAIALPALQCGAQGVVSLFANLLPQKWSKMMGWAQEKNFSEAFKIFDLYKPLIEILSFEENFLNIQYALSLKNPKQMMIKSSLKEPVEYTKQRLIEEMKSLGLLDRKI